MGSAKQFEIDGEHLAYLEAGAPEAPLVVCVHGFPDHAPAFERLMSDLATAGFRAVAPWLRGYAPSTLRGPYDMERISADLAALAESLSPDRRAVLIGHDWGAVATYFALARFPERFCRAVTLSVPHPVAFVQNAAKTDGQLRQSAYMLLLQLPWVAQRLVARDDFAYVDKLYATWSPGYLAPPEGMAELKRCLKQSLPAPLGYYRSFLRSARASRRALLDLSQVRLQVPTLYLHGARDGCIRYGAARGQERFFKAEFRSELLSGVGHFLHLEDPERVGARILEWLAPVHDV